MIQHGSGGDDAALALSAPVAGVAGGMVVYGDFNCPWSDFASRRAARLAQGGMEVDRRAEEHEPKASAALSESSERLDLVRAAALGAGGRVPNTGAAVAEYTQAYGVGEAAPVRELLFDALWLHAVDLEDARVVHTIVVDAIRSGATGSEPSPDGFHRVDASLNSTPTGCDTSGTDGPVSGATRASRRSRWSSSTVPIPSSASMPWNGSVLATEPRAQRCARTDTPVVGDWGTITGGPLTLGPICASRRRGACQLGPQDGEVSVPCCRPHGCVPFHDGS